MPNTISIRINAGKTPIILLFNKINTTIMTISTGAKSAAAVIISFLPVLALFSIIPPFRDSIYIPFSINPVFNF